MRMSEFPRQTDIPVPEEYSPPDRTEQLDAFELWLDLPIEALIDDGPAGTLRRVGLETVRDLLVVGRDYVSSTRNIGTGPRFNKIEAAIVRTCPKQIAWTKRPDLDLQKVLDITDDLNKVTGLVLPGVAYQLDGHYSVLGLTRAPSIQEILWVSAQDRELMIEPHRSARELDGTTIAMNGVKLQALAIEYERKFNNAKAARYKRLNERSSS